MPAERAAIEQKRGKSLGPRINRGRKTSRPSAHDNDVVEVAGIYGADETETASKIVFARIAQHLPSRTKHDRQFAGFYIEAVDQRLSITIVRRIEELEGMTVAPKKTLQPKYVRGTAESNNDRTARVHLNQTDSPQN